MKYLIICLFVSYSFSIEPVKNANYGIFFLTVNSVSKFLEFNWDFTDNYEYPPDSLTIVHKKDGVEVETETIDINGTLAGYQISNVKFDKPPFPGNWNYEDKDAILSSVCYPYWIQSKYNSEIIDSNCIKIEPSWMQHFGKLKIRDMMIPGTHDSGTWTCKHIPIVTNFLITQDYDLWGQLVSGIRYFDIRTGLYYNQTTIEWINHGVFQCSKMREEFEKVAKFLTLSPKEIVILHMKRFEFPEHFSKKDHLVVLRLLQEILGDHILPRNYFGDVSSLTLEEIWKTNKTLIVSYGDKRIVKEYKWLWNNILHKWGNKNNVVDLYTYLNSVKSNHFHPPTPFCSLMAELTPDGDYIIHNLDKGLRYMAQKVNPNLNVWLRKYKWSDVVNIVATDFFLGNDAISISIEANRRRLLLNTDNRENHNYEENKK